MALCKITKVCNISLLPVAKSVRVAKLQPWKRQYDDYFQLKQGHKLEVSQPKSDPTLHPQVKQKKENISWCMMLKTSRLTGEHSKLLSKARWIIWRLGLSLPPLPQTLMWTFKLQIKSAAQKCFWSLHFASFVRPTFFEIINVSPTSSLEESDQTFKVVLILTQPLCCLLAVSHPCRQRWYTSHESSNWSCNQISNNFTSFYHQAPIILNHISPSGDSFHPQSN